MGAVERSSSVVESQLSVLEESYGSFPVNQRTVSVPTAQYERKRRRADEEIELYAKVTNDESEVLHVRVDGDRVLPSTTAPVDGRPERAIRSTVAERTGIECRVEGVHGATILGLQDADDPERESVYRLGVIYEADRTGGSLAPDADWQAYEPDAHPVYV